LLERIGHDAYVLVLADHHRLIRQGISAHGGTEIATQGDGFFAVFPSASSCTAAVIMMQRSLSGHPWPADGGVRVRMGVHSGEAAETSAGLVGLEVNRAARIAAVAHGAQVVFSEAAVELARDSLSSGASFRDLGVHRLKDLGRPAHLFQLDAEGLPREFPALRSLDNPELPNNLPAQPASFVGRDREVGEIRALVESSRLVTLTGAGGAGKTRLALQVAAALLDGSGGGVWVVELAAVSEPDAVAHSVVDALGITVQTGRGVLESLVDALGSQEILIVLDNCEHLIDACAEVAGAILRQCPKVHLIATSREPLGINGEIIYRVPSLSIPSSDAETDFAARYDAVALFLDRVHAQGVGLVLDQVTAPMVVSICRRLDGMPLAIELAAARMRSLSLTDLSDRLDQRFTLLTGGRRASLPRQQTLQAAVQWSYSLLSPREQALLRGVSVFLDGFDLGAAEAIALAAEIDTAEVIDLLGSLVDKSLVVAEPQAERVRYRLLETIRQFAVERLLEVGEDQAAAVAVAHRDHFLAVAEVAAPHLTGPNQGAWIARLDEDRSNLRRALEHATVDPSETELALRFAAALRRYWWVTAARTEPLELLLPVLERPREHSTPQLLAQGLVTSARAATFADVQLARRLAERAVAIARGCDDDRLLVSPLRVLAAAHYFAGDYDASYPLAGEMLERARRLDDDVLLGEALSTFLMLYRPDDDADTEALFREAISCVQRSGDHYQAILLRNNASVHALGAGNLHAARDHLEAASQAGDAAGVTIYNVKINFGMVLRAEGDTDGAAATIAEALRISRRSADRYGLAYAVLVLACVAGDVGDWRRSAELHGVAQAFLDQIRQPWLPVYVRFLESSVDQARVALGHDEFQRCYARGRQLSFEDAIRLARGASTDGPVGALVRNYGE
jgi:predicted ATPase